MQKFMFECRPQSKEPFLRVKGSETWNLTPSLAPPCWALVRVSLGLRLKGCFPDQPRSNNEFLKKMLFSFLQKHKKGGPNSLPHLPIFWIRFRTSQSGLRWTNRVIPCKNTHLLPPWDKSDAAPDFWPKLCNSYPLMKGHKLRCFNPSLCITRPLHSCVTGFVFFWLSVPGTSVLPLYFFVCDNSRWEHWILRWN